MISANIEGLSAVKASMLSYLCKEQNCHCLCLQETFRGEENARPRILGMTLVAECPHDKYGSVIFIRDNLKMKSISVTAANHVVVITTELPDLVVHSVYKPPIDQFVLPDCNRRFQQPQGYDATDNNGVAVVQWAESNSLTLIHDVKQHKSFNSERWKKGYHHDLVFASSSIDNMYLKYVLNPTPLTQYRPICVTVNPVLVSL